MADDQNQMSEAETEEHDDSERARLWNEAVGVKQDGKEAPKEPEPAPEVDDKEEESVEGESEPESEDSDDEEEDSEDTEDAGEDDDPWSKAPEPLRKEFEETKSRYEHDIRSQRGRVGALQKQINDLSRKLEEATKKESPPAEAADPGDSLFKTPTWEKFKEDFGDVAIPIEDAIRLSYKDLHSRLQDTRKVSEELRSSDEQRRWEQEAVRLEREWPKWRDFIESNRDEFDSFVADNEVAGELLEPNKDNLTNASKAKALLVLFNDHLNAKTPKEKPASKEAKPKPEPRQLTPKRQQQLKSAATVAPRSAPGQGRRSDDLPDPDDQAAAWEFFAAKATR